MPRKLLAAAGVLLLAAATLLWWLPASWALPMLRASLHGLRLQQVNGTLWDGRAGRVQAPDGRWLGSVRWQLSRQALFGRAEARVDFNGPQLDFAGQMRQLPTKQVEWDGLRVRADLAVLADPRLHLPLGTPQGECLLTIEHVLLQGGWPLQMQAAWRWRRAALRTKQGELPLGELHGKLDARDGVIHAQWQDDGTGPLRTTGNLQLSPLGWRLDAALQARGFDPAMSRWLSSLGKPDAGGTVHVERSGGLAATLQRGKNAR